MGLAVGDALGSPIEFEERDSYLPITQMRAGGPFNLEAGQWTDDTSLAMCMGKSLIELGAFDAGDIIRRFHQWFRNGYMSATGHCFDIGNTTKAALLRYEETGALFSGSPDDPATNGSLMRLAPVPLFFYDDLGKTIFYSGESSRITHAPKECIDACLGLALLIHKALAGFSKEEVLHYQKDELNICPEIENILLGSYRNKSRDEISAKGLASTCLEAALWSFYQTDNFNDGVLLAVNLGEDSDTTGAVYGQLAGAFYGHKNIRSDFIEQLWDKELLVSLALDLFNPYFYSGENPTVDLIVINPDDEVLMITRSRNSKACPGMLAFPGGFIDSKAKKGQSWVNGVETPREAALRELAEETNLQLDSKTELIPVGIYSGNNRDPRDSDYSWSKTYAFLFRMAREDYDKQKKHIVGLDDAEKAQWIKADELQAMKLAFDHNLILQDARKLI